MLSSNNVIVSVPQDAYLVQFSPESTLNNLFFCLFFIQFNYFIVLYQD